MISPDRFRNNMRDVVWRLLFNENSFWNTYINQKGEFQGHTYALTKNQGKKIGLFRRCACFHFRNSEIHVSVSKYSLRRKRKKKIWSEARVYIAAFFASFRNIFLHSSTVKDSTAVTMLGFVLGTAFVSSGTGCKSILVPFMFHFVFVPISSEKDEVHRWIHGSHCLSLAALSRHKACNSIPASVEFNFGSSSHPFAPRPGWWHFWSMILRRFFQTLRALD